MIRFKFLRYNFAKKEQKIQLKTLLHQNIQTLFFKKI